jgi:hypothetical protein
VKEALFIIPYFNRASWIKLAFFFKLLLIEVKGRLKRVVPKSSKFENSGEILRRCYVKVLNWTNRKKYC